MLDEGASVKVARRTAEIGSVHCMDGPRAKSGLDLLPVLTAPASPDLLR